eukprot:8300504-Lingulodinium_polyedra.AAC.1
MGPIWPLTFAQRVSEEITKRQPELKDGINFGEAFGAADTTKLAGVVYYVYVDNIRLISP